MSEIRVEDIDKSISLRKYKDTMKRVVRLYYPRVKDTDLNNAIDVSISKRYKEYGAKLENNYIHSSVDTTLLKIADYINEREPIVTAHGVLFKKHGSVPNPLSEVVQSFLDQRSVHKKLMFQYPKGSEEYEKYNLMQQLDKIDCNGIYGVLGMYTSLVYNVNVATSITAQGRALVSSAGMLFEMFLANSVKFGSLNEVMSFIDNVMSQRDKRKFKDHMILDKEVSVEDCFGKIILSCGFNWIPTESEMDILWKCLNSLDQEEINRLYYKNNLYEFMNNSKMIHLVITILDTLEKPYLEPLKPPTEVKGLVDELTEYLMEYVYYPFQIIDRIDKMDRGIKSICMISDTDSTIISLDAWYRFVLEKVQGRDFKFFHQPTEAIIEYETDEFGDIDDDRYGKAIHFDEVELDYDFYNDDIIEMEHIIEPLKVLPQDDLRYSIINTLAYVLDKVVNDYMEQFTMNTHSYRGPGKCRILMKNEFLFKRALLTNVKKSYATIQETQEGTLIPQKLSTALDIKGIASMAKSSMSDYTRSELKKIMYEDILNADTIDQMKVVKKLAILEKTIMKSLLDGSKDYYKPVVVKATAAYKDPMTIQGVKASIVWNTIKGNEYEPLNLDERNAVDIAKVDINMKSIEKVKDKNPELYANCVSLLNNKYFKNGVDSIAIPRGIEIPEWLLDFIDYDRIVNENIGGFPLESIGCMRLDNNNVNWTNILKL